MDIPFDFSLLNTRLSNLQSICDDLETLIQQPSYTKQELDLLLVYLKNELRLLDVAIPGHKLAPILQTLSITPEELYILIFSNNHPFLKKALKGDRKSIIECLGAIRASISLWRTRVLLHRGPIPVDSKLSAEKPRLIKSTISEFEWDVFICHATEDKESFVKELASRLEQCKLRVWYDDFTLKIGDSLPESIQKGITHSQYGIAVLSHSFFQNDWPQRELYALLMRDSRSQNVILPIWLDVNFNDVHRHLPLLAYRKATKAEIGMDAVIEELLLVLKPN